MVWNYFNTGIGLGTNMQYFTSSSMMPYYSFIQPMVNYTPSFLPYFSQTFSSFTPLTSFASTTFTPTHFDPIFNTAYINNPFNTYSQIPAKPSENSNLNQTNPITSFSAAEHIRDSSKQKEPELEKINDVFAGYNEQSGKILAQNALNTSHDFHNQCSAHVNRAISMSNLGIDTDADAYEMFEILDANPNFKSIPPNTDTKTLPAGCIIVYDRGVSGYGNYGHIEISTGDGRGVSDGINNTIEPNPTAIYMPV